MHGGSGFDGSVGWEDHEAVGLGGGGEVAGALPGDARDGGVVPVGVEVGGKEASDVGWGLGCGDARLGKAWAEIGFAGERTEQGRGEEQESDHGRDGVAGQAEEGERGGIVAREFAEDGGLAGLDADAGEMEGGVALGECLLDEIVFAGGDAAGEQQQIAGFLCAVEEGVEIVEGVAGDAEAHGFAKGEGDLGGEAIAVGVANLVGLGGGVDLDEFVASGEDGDAGLREDLDLSGADGGERGDVCGGETRAGGDEGIAGVRLAADGNDVGAGTDFAIGPEADCAVWRFRRVRA